MNSYEKEIDRQSELEYYRNIKRLIGPFLLVCAASLLGTVSVIKSYYSLQWIPPWTQIWLCFFIATCTLGTIYGLFQNPSKKFAPNYQSKPTTQTSKFRGFTQLFGIAFTGYFLTDGGFVLATKPANEPTATLLISSLPTLFMFVLGLIILKERFRFRKFISLLVTLLGVVILVLKDGKLLPFISATTWYADTWLVIAAFFWSYQAVLIKQLCKTFSPLYITFMSCFIATVLFTPLMAIELWKQGKLISIWSLIAGDFHIVLAFLFLGIVTTAAAFYMWNRGIELTDISKGSVLYQFFLLVSQILQWFLFARKLGISFEAGGTIILLGIYGMIYENEQPEE